MAYAEVWMKNPARFILEYCQLKQNHDMANSYRNCGKSLNRKLWPPNDSFSYTVTLESLKTLYSSIIASPRENWFKKYQKHFSNSRSLFSFFIFSLPAEKQG